MLTCLYQSLSWFLTPSALSSYACEPARDPTILLAETSIFALTQSTGIDVFIIRKEVRQLLTGQRVAGNDWEAQAESSCS